MKTVAVVQARVGSSRLPAKVLLDLGGKPVLERCLDRVRRIECVNEVIIATTDKPDDDLIASFARRIGVQIFRGSESDVLERYVGAARVTQADTVVRITSDCPLLDPSVSAEVVSVFSAERTKASSLDYASSVLERRLPRGLDTEVIAIEALERAHRDATDPSEREHVTLHIYRRPNRFRLRSVVPLKLASCDLSQHRWTLDTLEDYRFLAGVYEVLGSRASDAGLDEILATIAEHPHLSMINAHVQQKHV